MYIVHCVHLVASKYFKCSVDHVKLKFYRVFNSIYAKSKRSEIVTVELMKSYCIPFILYATEALCLPKGILNMLDNCTINKALCKIFNVHTSDCIVTLRNFLHLPKLEVNIENRKVNSYTGYCQLKSLMYCLKYKPWTCCTNFMCVSINVWLVL